MSNDIDYSKRFICVVKDDIILEVNNAGETQEVGRTQSWCNELIDVANEYKQMCLDNGLIEEEKTPEQQQMEVMQNLINMVSTLTNKVEAMEHERAKQSNKPTSTGSESPQPRPKQSKPSSQKGSTVSE